MLPAILLAFEDSQVTPSRSSGANRVTGDGEKKATSSPTQPLFHRLPHTVYDPAGTTSFEETVPASWQRGDGGPVGEAYQEQLRMVHCIKPHPSTRAPEYRGWAGSRSMRASSSVRYGANDEANAARELFEQGFARRAYERSQREWLITLQFDRC